MLDRILGFNDMENDPTADRNREPSDPDSNMNIEEENIEEGGLMEGENEAFDEDEFEEEEFGPQEFSALNTQLDQLQSALDSLESRNDDIHSKLLDLLRSSREIRQGMTEENDQQEQDCVMDEEDEAEINTEKNVPVATASSSSSNVTLDKNCASSKETSSAVEN